MKREIRLRALALGLLLLLPGTSGAQQSIDRLNTAAGVLRVQSLTGIACAPSIECKAVVLKNHILLKDWSAQIQGAYPSQTDPKLERYPR